MTFIDMIIIRQMENGRVNADLVFPCIVHRTSTSSPRCIPRTIGADPNINPRTDICPFPARFSVPIQPGGISAAPGRRSRGGGPSPPPPRPRLRQEGRDPTEITLPLSVLLYTVPRRDIGNTQLGRHHRSHYVRTAPRE
jgi:hypothetical protein